MLSVANLALPRDGVACTYPGRTEQDGSQEQAREMRKLKILELLSMDWFCWENLQETHGFLPSNWLGVPVKIFPSSNSMILYLILY